MSNVKKRIVCIVALACCLVMNVSVVKATVTENPTPIEITNYSVSNGSFVAGEEVTVEVGLKNNNPFKLTDASVAFEEEGGMLTPVTEEKIIAIGDIDANSETSFSFTAKVSELFSGDVIGVAVTMSYLKDAVPTSYPLVMAIPVSIANSLEIKTISVADKAVVGGKSLLNVIYSNVGNDDIKDARIIISGNVDVESQSIVMPTIATGKSYQKDYSISFSQAGEQRINISFEYRDNKGNMYTIDKGTYAVNVKNEAVHNAEVVQDNSVNVMIASVGKVILALCVVISIVVYARKHN